MAEVTGPRLKTVREHFTHLVEIHFTTTKALPQKSRPYRHTYSIAYFFLRIHKNVRGLIKATSNKSLMVTAAAAASTKTPTSVQGETFNFTSTSAATIGTLRQPHPPLQQPHPPLHQPYPAPKRISNQYLANASKLINSLEHKINQAIQGSVSTKKSIYSLSIDAAGGNNSVHSLPPITPKINNHTIILPTGVATPYAAMTLIQDKKPKMIPSLSHSKQPFSDPKPPSQPTENRVKNFASKSVTGKAPSKPHKQNQDAYFVTKDFNGLKGVYLFGVLDGHGINGHLVSEYVKKRFPINLELAELKSLQVKSAFKGRSLPGIDISFVVSGGETNKKW